MTRDGVPRPERRVQQTLAAIRDLEAQLLELENGWHLRATPVPAGTDHGHYCTLRTAVMPASRCPGRLQ
jgi:hypothetical protein